MFNQRRIGKKKRLTDPVLIIPFPGELEKKNQPNVKSNNNNTAKEAPSLKISFQKEAKVLSAPTGKLKSEYVSIKDIENESKNAEQESENIVDLGNKPQKTFSYDDLKIAWRKYAYKAKEKGLDTLYSGMIQRDPIRKEGNKYEHHVNNDIQKRFFDQNISDLLLFLRTELENWSINLTISIEEEGSGSKNLYSGKDKYNDMAKRNPHLKTLKQKFKLDIDF